MLIKFFVPKHQKLTTDPKSYQKVLIRIVIQNKHSTGKHTVYTNSNNRCAHRLKQLKYRTTETHASINQNFAQPTLACHLSSLVLAD